MVSVSWLLEKSKQNAEDNCRFGSLGSDAVLETAVYLCHRATPSSVGIKNEGLTGKNQYIRNRPTN